VVFVTFLVAGLTGAKKILDWSFNDQGSMDGSARPSVQSVAEASNSFIISAGIARPIGAFSAYSPLELCVALPLLDSGSAARTDMTLLPRSNSGFKENEMTRSTARWTTAFAAMALLALPAAGLAQGAAQQPSQPPATAGAPAAQQPGQPDQAAAKQHLTAARNTLSEMTQLPAASQLTGDSRTQVSQLITNFNELITTPTAWKASYTKVQANLNALIGSATTDESAARTTGTEGAVGTAGSVPVDPAIKAKLIEFRSHLDKFGQAAGGASPSNEAASAAAAMDTPPAGTPPPAAAGTPPPTSPPTAAPPAQPVTPEQAAAAQTPAMGQHDLIRHVLAIEAILNVQAPAATATDPSATQSPVTLSPEQLEQLRTHLGELKRLLNQR
jgi:hypothetical protein